MIFHGGSSRYPQGYVKQEPYDLFLYATPPAQQTHDVGAERQHNAGFAETQSPGPASSTASSFGPFATMPKRPADGAPIPPAKQVKQEQPEEFSNTVKKRLASSTRTGQACDRCKVRKIRCDGLSGGCSPCLQNNTECRTTDRITGRATIRGYTEGIEQQNRDLQHRIRELEQRLMQAGADIKPSNGYHDVGAANFEYNQSPVPAWNPATPAYPPQNGIFPPAHQQETNMFRALPAFRAEAMGDNYLGVSPGNSPLSSIKGTALSILGMEIDIADFDAPDMDEPGKSVFSPQSALYNKSYQAFLMSALNVNPKLERPDLPSREDGFTYAQWYFRVLNPYMPLLHRPTFFKLLTRMYDDPTFRPKEAEVVMVHMVFAIMFFQYATRNWEDSNSQANLNQQSNLHYHYSLSMFYQLSMSHTVQDVQALTLICAHLRNFPKPGASWILTQTAMSLAIELGLHRSVKRWAPDAAPHALEIEMRKRTFWSLLAIHVTLSGKLGRPMPFRYEDFDVEYPDEVDDELLSENGVDTSRPQGRCLHVIGIQAMRLLPLFMELYSTIYAVRRQPEMYVATVNSLEAKIRAWKDGLSTELVKGEAGQSEQEGRVFGLYCQMWIFEFRLLLRHPSVSMTTDSAMNSESMRICVECSRQMLGVVRQLQKFKSLDTTWYNSAVYVMAITTTLFSQWDKRGETSAADLAALRSEMDLWLDIMSDVGALLGSGNRLREAVRVVTDGTLGLLSRSLPSKTQSYAPHNALVHEDSKPPSNRPVSTANYISGNQDYGFDNTAATNGNAASSAYVSTDNQMGHQQTPYPAATQYSTYPESSSSGNLTYTPQEHPHVFNYSSASASDSVDAPLLAALAAQGSQVAANASTWQRPTASQGSSGSHGWQQWTSTISSSLEPQDAYSANALMSLGGRDIDGAAVGNAGIPTSMGEMNANSQAAVMEQGVTTIGTQASAVLGTAWPLNIFDIGPGNTASQ